MKLDLLAMLPVLDLPPVPPAEYAELAARVHVPAAVAERERLDRAELRRVAYDCAAALRAQLPSQE